MEKLSENQLKVLRVLGKHYNSEYNCLYMRYIAKETGLEFRVVRLAVRALARKGLAEYHRGLFGDDGMVAGSGYCASYEGAMITHGCKNKQICRNLSDMVTGECQSCWEKRESAIKRAEMEAAGIPTSLMGKVSLCDLGILRKYYEENGIPASITPKRALAHLNKLVRPYNRHY